MKSTTVDVDTLIKKTKKNVLIKTGVILFYFIISIIFSNKVTKLSEITSQGIFGSSINSWALFYYLFIIITLILFSIVYSVMYYNTQVKVYSEKIIRKFHSIYDFTSFLLVSMISFFFAIMFIFTPCTVSGNSMNNTYLDGDKLVVWHMAYTPKNEDVVVIFTNTENYASITDLFILKRVVASPGDLIEFRETENIYVGQLFVNSILVEPNFTINEFRIITSNSLEKTYIIPEKRYLVLGDNRGGSADSRLIGLIHEEDILGKVIFRILPFNKMGRAKKNIK